MQNNLYLETSPYLLQHANNPVHWQAWHDKTLALAQDTKKLIVISIGYSACHWCHVMERESFEDETVALIMNTHFINIKIDREERPDVDSVYMRALKVMTRQGGWPLNIVALPDGRPVWGGTYFKKENWIEALLQLQELYELQLEKMVAYATKLHEGLQAISLVSNSVEGIDIKQYDIESVIIKWKVFFDRNYGGYEGAPKFMMPNTYLFLLRYGFQTQDKELLDFVDLTLTKMAYGGIFDTVGGGFSRYSVDMRWHIPHFEKMLYDNGQLVSLYAEGYRWTKKELYKTVIEKTLSFVSRELTSDEGGFFSALDADSMNDKGQLEEGAFYVWKEKELEMILKEDYILFCTVFNINSFGYCEHDRYVLIQSQDLDEIAYDIGWSTTELMVKKSYWEALLFAERQKRQFPRRDDKCLTSWNAIMLKGYIDAYKVLGNKEYLDVALRNAAFILNKMWRDGGGLYHNYKDKKASINGYLEDYAFVIDAFIALYEVTVDENWLYYAKQLTDYCFDHFYKDDQQTNTLFFSFTSNLDDPLILPHFEIEDHVIPSSNSVMAMNLYKLNCYFDLISYEIALLKMLRNVIFGIDYPPVFSNWLHVYLVWSQQQKEVVIAGDVCLDYMKQLYRNYGVHFFLTGTAKTSSIPLLKEKYCGKETLFFVCQHKVCSAPFTTFEELLFDLKI